MGQNQQLSDYFQFGSYRSAIFTLYEAQIQLYVSSEKIMEQNIKFYQKICISLILKVWL
jgi:hypothetical protein